jgi:hypothetical protein
MQGLDPQSLLLPFEVRLKATFEQIHADIFLCNCSRQL